jgi:hypothetical protein
MRGQPCEILVPVDSRTANRLGISEQATTPSDQEHIGGTPPLVVDRLIQNLSVLINGSSLKGLDQVARMVWQGNAIGEITDANAQTLIERIQARRNGEPPRTVAKHGLTGPEIGRFNGAIRYMDLRCSPRKGRLWWATVSNASTRALIADVQKRVTRLQKANHLCPYNATVFETRGGLHAHIVFIGNTDVVDRLKSSTKFHGIEVKRVTDASGLSLGYLAKERTPQGGYRRQHMLGGRLRGSHRLDGGGDRVRLSRELERDAIEAGYVEPWQHTNARRATKRKPYKRRRLRSHKAPRPAGQLPLLPEIDRPVARLRHFGGGFIPPAVAREVEFRRKRLGFSQRELGDRIGVSQSQIANAIRGHDPISSTAINRIREILL